MARLRSRFFSTLFKLGLLTLALWTLFHELRGHRYTDVVDEFHRLPAVSVLAAILLTILSYIVQTGYDWLAFRASGGKVPYRVVGPVSFIAYAFSNTMGYAVFTGGSVRYRFYSALGVSAARVAQVVLFCGLTLWMGFFALAGLVFLLEPAPPFGLGATYPSALRGLGLAFLAVVAAYLVWVRRRGGRSIRFRGAEIAPPPLRLVPAQILVSALDWLLAAGVVYVLLPSGSLTPTRFLALFFVAQAGALASGVPGGLGVFEGLMVLSLSPGIPADAVLGLLLAYRAIYYLIPFCLALLLLLAYEALKRRANAAKALARLWWLQRLVPHLIGWTTFMAGVILLFSGSAPSLPHRMRILGPILPLPVIEFSHFLGSLAGVGLIILARGIQLRLRIACVASLILIASGAVLSLTKGLDYEEASILLVMFALLWMARGNFHRNSSLLSQPFTAGWVMAIGLVLVCSAWLGLFAYKHVDYSNQLWWQFSLRGDAPRYLRAMVATTAMALLFGLAKLTRPGRPHPSPPTSEELELVREIVAQSPRTGSKLALLGDKNFLFSPNRRAFIMYRVWRDSWIAMGDPVGPEAEWPDLIWEFRQSCHHFGDRPVFYQVGGLALPFYLDVGLSLLKLGEEARVRLDTFSLEGASRKGFRHVRNRLEKGGCHFETVPVKETVHLLDEMEAVSDAWLAEKNTKEKSFSLGSFDRDYLGLFPTAVVRLDGQLLAFANVWEGADHEELSIDLMRHRPDAPDGVMDYLLTQLMLLGKERRYRYFNLGMAPLSGFQGRQSAPAWNRLAHLVYRHGEHFYNFQGLRRYKEKFEPEWQPRFLASPGGLSVIPVLTDLASIISGGLKGAISK